MGVRRGVFSWYLIQGLTGMADADQDPGHHQGTATLPGGQRSGTDVAPKRQTPSSSEIGIPGRRGG